jgi:signal transduction histidine kinase
MRLNKKHILYLSFIMISILPFLGWSLYGNKRKPLSKLVWHSILNSISIDLDNTQPITHQSNRRKLKPYLNWFRNQNISIVLSYNKRDILLGTTQNGKNCSNYLYDNKIDNYSLESWDCFSIPKENIYLAIKVPKDKTFIFSFMGLIFLIIPLGLITSFIIIVERKNLKTSLFLKVMRKTAAGKIPILDPKLRDEFAEFSKVLAVMTASLKEKENSLKTQLNLIKQQADQLEKSRHEILRREKLSTLGYLSAGIAHELGNPIAAISGLIELHQTEDLPPQIIKENYIIIVDELSRMDILIRKLLEFSSPSREVTQNIDINEIILKAIKLVSHHKNLTQIKFINKLTPNIPHAKGSKELVQVFINLFINAGQAQKGEGEIRIFNEIIEDKIKIYVQDKGPGIKIIDAEKIFEPFMTTKDPGEGTGLGLSVSRVLMEKMDGELTLEKSGNGTCFCVSLFTNSNKLLN